MDDLHARDVELLRGSDLLDFLLVTDKDNLRKTSYLGIETRQHDFALVGTCHSNCNGALCLG
jgi:hypothetical protein